MAGGALYADGFATVTPEAATIGDVTHPLDGLTGVAVREPERWPYVPGAIIGAVGAMLFLSPFNLAGFLAGLAVMLAFAAMAFALPCTLVLGTAGGETAVQRSCRACERIRAAILKAVTPRPARRPRPALAKPGADG